MLNMLAFSKQRDPQLEMLQLNRIVSDVVELEQSHADDARIMLLADPDGLLKGSGSRGRHIPDVDKATFAVPGVEALIARAIALTDPPFNPKAKRRLLIKSVSAKQRPRRPAPK